MQTPLRQRLSLLFLAALVPLSFAAPAQPLAPLRVAENVYAFIGAGGTGDAGASTIVGNAGFLVGPEGVIVVDTGISMRQGARMIEAIRGVTDRPIVLVIITHAVQEFVFGAGAFEAIGAPIGAHQATIDLMRARCQHCLEALEPRLGVELSGTRLVLPTIAWGGPTRLTAGGLDIDLLHFGWAATPGDIAVFDRRTGTLFAGGLLAVDHVPEIRDCDFPGWLGAIAALRDLPVEHIVPGHGAVTGRQALADTEDYLSALDRQVRALYAESSSLMEALQQSDLPGYAHWAGYDLHHRRNVLHRYLQLEIEELGGDPRSTALPQQ
jgi:glyoxylase-like metal-dependent hydrolase (beta-lactamase superfamily II)